jgi:serine protease Do
MALFALAVLMSGPVAAQARSAPESFADLAAELLPGVVNISTTQTVSDEQAAPGEEDLDQFFKDFLDRQRRNNPQQHRATSLGSGFVIDASGYIVTNNHVISGAEEITVRFHDDSELKAKLVGSDEKTDLALLKVESPKPIVSLSWGDSDALRIGDWVLAIGNPFSLGGTVTAGIVSARNRDINSGPYDNYIQTDASINRGNSGGPLFNMDGEVVGVNTAIISPSGGSIGIGFAVPSKTAMPVIDQLRNFGETRRGWLGVKIQQVTDEIAESLNIKPARGALIAGVDDKGPAKPAGIEAGDVVVKFDGKDIKEMRDLPRIVADTPVGKDVPVVIIRKGKEQTKTVKLGRLEDGEKPVPASAKSEPTPEKSVVQRTLGLQLSDMTDALREKYKIKDSVKGVVITEVDAASVAADKRLTAGSVLVAIEQEQITNAADVRNRVEALKKAGKKTALLLVATSAGDMLFVALPIN